MDTHKFYNYCLTQYFRERRVFPPLLRDITDMNIANVRKTINENQNDLEIEESQALLDANDENFLHIIRSLLTTDKVNIVCKSARVSLKTALHFAVKNDDSDIVKFLLENGANVHTKFDGKNPLELAFKTGKIDNCKTLIEHGAEFGPESCSGKDYEYLLHYQDNFKNAVKQVTNNNGTVCENKYKELSSQEIQWLKELKAKELKEVDSQMIAIDHKLDEERALNNVEIAAIRDEVDQFKEKCKEQIASVEDEISIARKKIEELETKKESKKSKMTMGIQKLKKQEKEIQRKTEQIEYERLVNVALKTKLNQEFKMIDAEWKRKSKNQQFKDYLLEEIKNLEKELKCPSCGKVSEVPTYTCPSQHSICGKCWNDRKIYICPVCNVSIQNPPNRHRLMERMVDKLEKFKNAYDDLLKSSKI